MPSRTDFDRHIKGNELLPCYALVGNESWLVTEALTALRARVLTRAADFNRHEYRAGGTPMEQIVAAARTLPMMAEYRFVLIYDCHKLVSEEQNALLAYLQKPVTTTIFVLAGDKLDMRTKLGGWINKSNYLFAFDTPRGHALAGWIERRAQACHYTIRPDAAQLLADLIGPQLGVLANALEKVALYAGEKMTISTEHVEACVAATRVNSIFELTDALGRREVAKCALLSRNLVESGESPMVVLAMVARQLRQLLQLRQLRSQGKSGSELSQALGVAPFVADTLDTQAKRFSDNGLIQSLAAVARADAALKSSGVSGAATLDRLFLEILSQS